MLAAPHNAYLAQTFLMHEVNHGHFKDVYKLTETLPDDWPVTFCNPGPALSKNLGIAEACNYYDKELFSLYAHYSAHAFQRAHCYCCNDKHGKQFYRLLLLALVIWTLLVYSLASCLPWCHACKHQPIGTHCKYFPSSRVRQVLAKFASLRAQKMDASYNADSVLAWF